MQKEIPSQKPPARAQRRRTRPAHNICVYCGSGPGAKPIYAEAARALGGALAVADIGLVYGGGSRGLMGEVARAALAAGGYVSGIIPDFLYGPEQALENVQDLVVVKSMHHRKQEMYERSDAFIALPGGVGTLEELVEQLTWAQIGHHSKPIAIVDTGGYWQPFVTLISHMRENAFIRPGLEVELIVAEEPAAVLAAVRQKLEVTTTQPQPEKLITDQM